MRLEPFGSEQSPMRSLINLRASKIFTLGGKRNVQVDLDALNAFNSNTAWITNYLSGPTFGVQSLASVVSSRAIDQCE